MTTSLTFDPENWNEAQFITITGLDDQIDDGDIEYLVLLGPVTSDDLRYHESVVDDLIVTNVDDDTAGIVVSPVSGLVTTEAGGTSQFTVQLTSRPLSAVTISVTSDNTNEGTVSTELLTKKRGLVQFRRLIGQDR